MSKKSASERLGLVQDELNAPKNLINSFGGYSYRNAEGILEAAKPLLKKHGLRCSISDCVVLIGEMVFIEAQVRVFDRETGVLVDKTEAQARHAESKKGMDDSQVSGSTSSYARKYALNGMFLIDDVKDADATNTHGKDKKAPAKKTPAKKAAPKKSGGGW